MYRTKLTGIIFLYTLVCAIFIVFNVNELRGEENRSMWEKRGNIVKEPIPIEKPSQDQEQGPELNKATEPVIKTETASTPDSQNQIDPESISIPTQYGSITETHKGYNGKLIVHVQDAHSNYEAQKNSAAIIESLIKNYDLTLVLKEAKITDKDFKYIRERATLDIRKETADNLLKQGYITGINYLDIASDYPIKIRGLEDIDLYDSQRQGMWEIDNFKDIAVEYVNKMTIAADILKNMVYNKGLLEIDAKKREYEDEKIDMVSYYEFLYETAQKKEIPLYTFPNFINLAKAREIEKKMNSEKDTENIESAEAEEAGDNTLNQADLYREYRELTQNLNINDLFKEEPLLENTVREYMAETSDQRKLIRISKALSILSNLLKIKVVPEEYQYFQENKSDFQPDFWTGFLQKKSQEIAVTVNIPDNSYAITDNLAAIEKFYDTALKRDKMFVKRAAEHLEKEGSNFAALIAGGFHTPTLTKLLADEGYSYIVISPKVTTKTDDAKYRWALKFEWLPEIEKLKKN